MLVQAVRVCCQGLNAKAYKGLLNEPTMKLISKYGHKEFQGVTRTRDLRNMNESGGCDEGSNVQVHVGAGGECSVASDKELKAGLDLSKLFEFDHHTAMVDLYSKVDPTKIPSVPDYLIKCTGKEVRNACCFQT